MITRVEIHRTSQGHFVVSCWFNGLFDCEKRFETLLGAVLWLAEQEGFVNNRDFGEIFTKD